MSSLASLRIKQTSWRTMTDRKDMADLQTQDEKAWIARITPTWSKIQKKIMKTVMIEGVRENSSNSNGNIQILMLSTLNLWVIRI